jgi:signal transduction histidine kinase
MPFARSQPFWHLKNVGFSPIRLGLLAGAIALMCLAGVAAMALSLRADEARRWVEHTVEVRQFTGEFLNTLVDAETSVRGYLLSDDPTFLETYKAATPKLTATLERLQALTADNPAQRARLQQISRTSEQLGEIYRQMLDLAAQGQREATIGLVKTRAGKALMDDARVQIAAFDKIEREMLAMREGNAARLRMMLMAAVIGALACAIGLLLFFAKMSYDYVRQLDLRTAELENEARRRQESEATLIQAQKMEAVGQLTGGIAHDFNNMLTVIIGSLETLQRRLKHMQTENDDAEKLGILTKPTDLALQGARNAAKLTHRLLAFARRQPLAPVQLDLNKVVGGMSELLRRTLGETIIFETVLGAGLWRTFVDANQLENVLLNLVVNARDAMPNGGHLTIESSNAYLDDAYAARFGDVVPGQYVLLSVTDTGSGMSPELLARVFEPFFSTKGDRQGSGLGLAMVHGFVKQSGGHIRIYSELNEGTSVKIYLPRIKAVEAAANPEELPQRDPRIETAANRSETVLVVEDNDDVRQYAQSALEELGYTVLQARDAAEALQIVENGARVDLLFTDVVLPGGMNGRQLSRQILQKRPTLPVLFTTGYTPNAIVHHGRLDPDVQLLSKPYTQSDLSRKVRAMLDR